MKCKSINILNKVCNGEIVEKECTEFKQWGTKFRTEMYECSKCGKTYTGSTYRVDRK